MRTRLIVPGLELYDYPKTCLIFSVSPEYLGIHISRKQDDLQTRLILDEEFRLHLSALIDRAFPGKHTMLIRRRVNEAIRSVVATGCFNAPPGIKTFPYYIVVNRATLADRSRFASFGKKSLECFDDLITALKLYANDPANPI